MLGAIISRYGGGPVGIEALAATLQEETDTLTDVVEPYLLQQGFLIRTSSGRRATARAYDHLGVDAAPVDAPGPAAAALARGPRGGACAASSRDNRVRGIVARMRFDLAHFPTLTTERLILREVIAEDAPDLLAFRGDPEVQRYNLVPMKDTREALALVRTMQGWYMTRYAIQWGITLPGEDRVLGLCGLHDWNRQHRRASLGYDLVRSHWGQGLAYEAMQAVLRFGFDEMDLEPDRGDDDRRERAVGAAA